MANECDADLERDLVFPLIERVLQTIVVASAITSCASLLANNLPVAALGVANVISAAILLRLARRGHPKIASQLEAVFLSITTVLTLVLGYGLLDVSILIFPGIFLLTSVLSSKRWMVAIVVIADVSVLAVGLAEKTGILVHPASALIQYDDIFDAMVLLTTMAAFVHYLVATLRRAIVRTRLALKRTRDILDATSDAIVIHDARDGRILEVNQPMLRLFGCTRDELVGQVPELPASLATPRYVDKAAEHIEPTISQGTQAFEWLAAPSHGAPVWVEVVLRSADISDEPCVVAVLRDITARRQLQQRVQEAEMFRALGQLAGGIAHDFNNQLTGIFGNAEFLRLGLSQNASLRSCADEILVSARRAADLTQKLLAFARRGRRRNVPTDLHQLIIEVSALGRHSIDKRVGIEQHLEAESAVALGDPSALQNALLNLLLNARDAMPHGGTVRFATRNLEITPGVPSEPTGPNPGRYIEIRVEDTGTGIASEHIGRVFEPFFTTKDSGTGMGLAAVQGTVLEHQGSVELSSEVGRGSIFRLLLPVVDKPALVETVMAPLEPSSCGHGRVLVVDDESTISSLVARALEMTGYNVVTCGGGQQAIDRYRPHDFDLVLLDVMMPDLDGVQVLQHIRTLNPYARVLLMTGNADESVRTRLGTFSDVPVISKPFLPRELVEQVREILQR